MLHSIFEDTHSKRIDSLSNYAVGAMTAARAGIRTIGAAYAAVAGIQPKSGIKQVDRYLSNEGINIEALMPAWSKFVLGPREAVRIALDWTEFDDNRQATLAAYVITTHGRATPLAWKTVDKSTLRNRRTRYEHEFVECLARAIPPGVEIELLADRGFGDQKLYQLLDLLGWDYTIRFRGNIMVELDGVAKPAKDWIPASGRATRLVGAKVTGKRVAVAAVVVVHNKKMKEPWCLVTSRGTATASSTVKRYGRRFTIEETFRESERSAIRLGAPNDVYQQCSAPRPIADAAGDCPSVAHVPRRCRRASWTGSLSQDQYIQETYTFAFSARLRLVQRDSYSACRLDQGTHIGLR